MDQRGAGRRAAWNVFDQILSSGTNAVLSFLVARSVAESEFGGFAVAFTVFALLVGVSRAVSTSPLGIRFSHELPSGFRPAARSAVGTALVLGCLAGLGCLVAAVVAGGAAGSALFALGLVLPGLLVQDAWRMTFFAQGRPAAAAFNDAVWAVIQLTAVWLLLSEGISSIGPLVLAWGGAATGAALLGVYQARMWPHPPSVRTWLREHRNLTGYLLAEFATLQASQQGAMLVIAALGSLAAIGALRGAQIILGPTTILALGIFTFAVPEYSRRRRTLNAHQWFKAGVRISFVVVSAGLCWGLIFLLLPDSAGEALLGDSWAGTHAVLLASIVGQAGAAAAVGPAAMLYAMDRAPVTLRVHGVLAPLLLVLGVGGVLVGGAEGAAWGFALAFWSVVPSWWLCLRREAKTCAERRDEPVSVAAAGPADAPAGSVDPQA